MNTGNSIFNGKDVGIMLEFSRWVHATLRSRCNRLCLLWIDPEASMPCYPGSRLRVWVLFLYLVASLLDLLDGYVARKLGQ
jgi:phosphatidylglycerophosphate synthase